jgi:PncC family amidohydrolase
MDETTLESLLGERLRQRGLKLATAESCTGGLIGHRITNVPGSSDYFLGGVVSYAYEAKVKLLGVRWETLEKFGAVSRETVLEMASGARRALETDIGLAVSGIAGPGGATPTKPVGLTWIGLSTPGFDQAWAFVFAGDRWQVKEQAAEKALELIVDYLENGADRSHGQV